MFAPWVPLSLSTLSLKNSIHFHGFNYDQCLRFISLNRADLSLDCNTQLATRQPHNMFCRCFKLIYEQIHLSLPQIYYLRMNYMTISPDNDIKTQGIPDLSTPSCLPSHPSLNLFNFTCLTFDSFLFLSASITKGFCLPSTTATASVESHLC